VSCEAQTTAKRFVFISLISKVGKVDHKTSMQRKAVMPVISLAKVLHSASLDQRIMPNASQMTRRPSKSSKSKFRGISRKWLTFYDTSELNCLEIFVHWLKFSFWQLREKFKHFIANRNVARFARIFKPKFE
jgi:hypothetical protein